MGRYVHLSSLILVTCPAHFHFCLQIYLTMSTFPFSFCFMLLVPAWSYLLRFKIVPSSEFYAVFSFSTCFMFLLRPSPPFRWWRHVQKNFWDLSHYWKYTSTPPPPLGNIIFGKMYLALRKIPTPGLYVDSETWKNSEHFLYIESMRLGKIPSSCSIERLWASRPWDQKKFGAPLGLGKIPSSSFIES